MNFQKKGLLTALLFVLAVVSAQAQITNDTTKMLYGPTTTRVFYEHQFLRGNYTEAPVDTSIDNSFSNLYWFGDTIFQQTLENIGLATKNLPFQYSNQIGARPGRNAFDYYGYRPENITYFDSRSPYTTLKYIKGSLGEGIFEGEFNRNIKKWWNAGLAYNRILADKQLGGTRNNGQVDNNSFKFYTHLQSTNNRYHLFANYTHMNVKFVETGGVQPLATDTSTEQYFEFLNEQIKLNQATGRDVRHSFHIGQTFNLLGNYLKVYHSLDQKKQSDRFDDLALKFTGDTTSKKLFFYPNEINYDSVETHDRTTFTQLENTFGVTGSQKHFLYNGYLKFRNATWDIHKPDPIFQNSDIPFKQTFNQVFAGGDIEGRINDKIYGVFRAEYKLPNEYFTQGELRFWFLKLQQTRISASPTLIQQTYFGNSYSWNNDFNNTTTDRTSIQIQGELWHNRLRLEGAATVLNNYIVFNRDELPQQISKTQNLYTLTADHALTYGKLHWNNLLVYSNTADAEYIRVPDFLINSKIYYQGFIFKKALFGQIGLETTFRTDYFGDAYSPALQQFYIQNDFKLDAYPVVDVFIAADIKSLNVFLKLAHANEGFTGNGYFATPYYPGIRRSFLFGIKWSFFD